MGHSDALDSALWARGELSWKLRPHQAGAVQAFRESPGQQFMWLMHRQGGKTFTLSTIAIGEALRSPGTTIFYGTYSLKATRGILRPTFAEILEDCPRDLRPSFNSIEGEYQFPNGSIITCAGLDEGRADDYRGRKAALIIVDEAGFISDLGYVVRSVLYPMTKTTRGRVFLATTPPRSPGHYSAELARDLEALGAFVRNTIYDDTAVTPNDIERFKRECGGDHTSHWRREYMAELVVDEEKAVVPEFTAERQKLIVQPVETPRHFYPLVAMDVGFDPDLTFVVFGYYDFRRAQLCVQDEIVMKRMTTDDLAANIKAKEKVLWADRKVDSRVSDTELLLIHDLSNLHNLAFAPTAKDHKEAQINELRIWVKDLRLRIDPRCTNLVRHLKNAVWKENRSTYERSSIDGHYDGVDALVYMLRNAPIHSNPYPVLPEGVSEATHFIPEPEQRENAKVWVDIFRGRN